MEKGVRIMKKLRVSSNAADCAHVGGVDQGGGWSWAWGSVGRVLGDKVEALRPFLLLAI